MTDERDETIARLRAELVEAKTLLAMQRADDQCWLKSKPEDGSLPPKPEFLESCSRFYDQTHGDKSPLECPTIAQLTQQLAEARKLAEERKAALDSIACAIYPRKTEPFTYAVPFMVKEIEELHTLIKKLSR